MQITFTQHALVRMAERGITHDEVLAALMQPVRTVPAHNDLLEAQGWIDRAGKRMLLRVIYKAAVMVSVITVMAASKFEK